MWMPVTISAIPQRILGCPFFTKYLYLIPCYSQGTTQLDCSHRLYPSQQFDQVTLSTLHTIKILFSLQG